MVVLALELPTGGLADALGRRPVLIGAALANLASLALLTFADSIGLFLAVSWLASAAGAALVPALGRWLGRPAAAMALRVLQGATVVGMALLAGPASVLTAYLFCYVVHGAANPLHMGLLRRQVDGPYRASVISLNSMIAQPGGSLGLVVLTAVAAATTVSTAMLVGAVVLAIAAPLYLPSWLAARRAPAPAAGPAAARQGVPAGQDRR